MKKKISAIILAVIMVLGMIGCGNNNTEKDKTSESTQEKVSVEASSSVENQTPAIDVSERVDLICYFVGDPPADMQKVQDKINEILLEKINATITFQHTTWTNTNEKYYMILSGGEQVDIICTNPWRNYYGLIEKGAFLELNDLIDQYAPELRSAVGENFFDLTYIDGELYTVPNNYVEYNTGGIVYREDLRKKYDLPVPDTMENVKAFMAGIKENDPTMQVINPQCANILVWLDKLYALKPADNAGINVPYNDVNDIQVYWGSQEHIDDMKQIREWALAGYWPSDAIGESTTNSLTSFEAGETALMVSGVNYNKYLSSASKMKELNAEWEIGFVDQAEFSGVTYPAPPYNNGTAIPTNSKNPERAMMAIGLLYTNEELNHLLMYGIEGEHYTVDANGYYVEGDNYAAYPYEGANSWAFRNVDYMLNRESSQAMLDHFAYLDTIAAETVTPFVNHSTDYSGVITETVNEKAAVDALKKEYLIPLEYGMVDDIEEGIAQFIDAANKAGLQKVQDEVVSLWNEYLESKGY